MNKPTIKREVQIKTIYFNMIIFWATREAAEHFSEFGRLLDLEVRRPRDTYTLLVDGRYDFDEVVQYIKDYSNQNSEPPEWLD